MTAFEKLRLKLIRMLKLLGNLSRSPTRLWHFVPEPDWGLPSQTMPEHPLSWGLVIMLSFALLAMLASAKFWSFYCKTCLSEYSKWLPPVAFSHLCSAPNSFFAGALPRTPLRELTALPQMPYWFEGALLLRWMGGDGQKWMGQQRDRGERKGGERRRGDGPLRKFLDPPPDALTFARSKHQKPKGYACRMATKFSSAVSRLLTSFLPKPLFYLASMVTGMSTSIHATSTYGNFLYKRQVYSVKASICVALLLSCQGPQWPYSTVCRNSASD